ncbi:unnamed protein product [Periconia digitata]|uniref:Uncharacterized protein n=1 Tax=Periconia digitata TaxID=1303443 RepID=A0A9W4UMZ1_9PLEO|nr:unnamed protein product [Periconia digitata]
MPAATSSHPSTRQTHHRGGESVQNPQARQQRHGDPPPNPTDACLASISSLFADRVEALHTAWRSVAQRRPQQGSLPRGSREAGSCSTSAAIPPASTRAWLEDQRVRYLTEPIFAGGRRTTSKDQSLPLCWDERPSPGQ